MKKLVILAFAGLFLIPINAFSGCIIDVCFNSEVDCSEGEIEDVNHTCRSCLDINPIELGFCRNKEEILRRCPNRQFAECSNISFISSPYCPKGEFMGDDGKCYSCDVDKSISYSCIGFKKLEEACPNRLIEMCGGTVLKCPENQEPVNKLCTPKCDAGFTRNEYGACCNNDGCNLDEW